MPILKSLFGDLSTLTSEISGFPRRPGDFVVTAVMETTDAATAPSGRAVDRHVRDLFVTGAPAEAMREQLASAWGDSQSKAKLITLYDPARMWSGAVIKNLSDATGHPIERLHLRDQATLATLAMVERTTLSRRGDDEALKVYHADLRSAMPDGASVPLALMENSHLGAVVIGPMHSAMLDAMLAAMALATHAKSWHCPHVVFFLPVGAPWIERKIRSVAWPRKLSVHCLDRPLTSASEVWDQLVAQWDAVRPIEAARAAAPVSAGTSSGGVATGASSAPSPIAFGADFDGSATNEAGALEALPQPIVRDISLRPPDELAVLRAMRELATLDGVIAAALVRRDDGVLVASEGHGTLDLELAAAAATDVMRAHLRTVRYFAPGQANVDEIAVTVGPRQWLLRTVDAHPELFLLIVLDRQRARLDTARSRLDDAQSTLL